MTSPSTSLVTAAGFSVESVAAAVAADDLSLLEHAGRLKIPPFSKDVPAWRIRGTARIDDRPQRPAVLALGADGSWTVEVDQFTLAAAVDVFFVADNGGHFCGPASVQRSRVDTDPMAMRTFLTGYGPLLVVDPTLALPAIEDDAVVDGEVIE